MLTEDMKRIVREQSLGFVATVCPDGTANLSPKGTTAVLDDDHLVFLDIHSPGTVENLLNNPSVEINVVDPFVRKGYRFKGTGRVLSDGPEFEQVLERFYEERPASRRPGRAIHHLVLVTVTESKPLVSPAYDDGVSEAEVVAGWRERYERLLSERA